MSNILYNEAFKISVEDLDKYDVFNGYIDRDSLYYIAPSELKDIKINEFSKSYKNYLSFFEKIITLLKKSNGNDRLYKTVEQMFLLNEIGDIGLGYSKNGKDGSGIGPKLAQKLTKSSYEIVKAGIDEPEIFQLVGLFEEKIGADRISDITVAILIIDFLYYTQNVSQALKLETYPFKYNNIIYNLPFNNKKPIIFCPKRILTALPVAFDFDDIDYVCSHNQSLRKQVNNIIANCFTNSIKTNKLNIKKLIIDNPDIVKYLIKSVQENTQVYDFDNDPKGNFIWKSIVNNIDKSLFFKTSPQQPIIDTVFEICENFKVLVENNGLWKTFHNYDDTHKDESFSQLLFFGIADAYCKSFGLDLSPEVDAGCGPVDFKISNGNQKVNVEIKLSTNRLQHGLETQLPTYNKAAGISNDNSILLIIQLYDNHNNKIEKLYKYKNQQELAKNVLPHIYIIDATVRKSASKI